MTARTFDGERSCLVAARRFVINELAAAGQSSSTEIAVLLTSELATNVVLHAGTSFEVVVETGPSVIRIEIHDGRAVTDAFRDLVANPPRSVEPTMVGGRGLLLIGSTALRFGLDDKGPEGKAIWFELAASPDSSDHSA